VLSVRQDSNLHSVRAFSVC